MRWSNSALYVAQACGEKFRRMYLERDFRPSGISAKRGTAAHKVANEAHMRQLRAKQEGRPREEYLTAVLPTAEEAKDIAADSFQRALDEGCAFTADEKAVGVEKVTGDMKDQAVRMGAHYVGVIAPPIDPVAVERKTIIKPAGFEEEITGIVDLVSVEDRPVPEADSSNASGILLPRKVRVPGPRETLEIVNDLKTSARSPSEDAVEKSQQLPLYALIRAAETGKIPERLRLRTMVQTRTGKVSHVEQSATTSTENLNAVAERLGAAMRSAKAGNFVPANPDSWWCSERWCSYWSDCRFAMGRPSSVVVPDLSGQSGEGE